MAKKKKTAVRDKKNRASGDSNGSDTDAAISQSSEQLFYVLGIVSVGLTVCSPLVAEGAPEQFTNWISFLLWIVTGILLSGLGILSRQRNIICSRFDVCVYALFAWICLSGLVTWVTESGHARPTINSTFQWFGYAVAYFVLRQMSSLAGFRKTAVLAMVSISIGCSVAAVYQRYIVLPEIWQAYKSKSEAQKQETLRLGGLTNVEPGSREREMWERRLLATEPTATFVLTNSLAAFLTPWFVILLALSLKFVSRTNLAISSLLIAAGLLVLFALLLTKSRTSYLAAGLGAVAVTLAVGASRGLRISPKLFFISIGIAGVIAAIGFGVGAVDIQVVSEAFKSFSYRLEYWQASLSMIQDEWIFGCGPGNFQHAYAKYQFAEASETVSDPHNFFIEIWAIAGTPAMVMICIAFIVWLNSVRKSLDLGNEKDASVESAKGQHENGNHSDRQLENGDLNWMTQLQLPLAVIVGAAIAIYVSLLSDLNLGLCAISSLVAILCSLTLMSIREDVFDRAVIPIAVCTFFVGLSASGGISFPSVTYSGILLMAISAAGFQNLCDTPPSGDSNNKRARKKGAESSSRVVGSFAGIFVLFVVAALTFRMFVIDPIRIATAQSAIAEMELRNGNMRGALGRLDAAIAADPYDGNYLFFRLQLLFRQFQRTPAPVLLDAMESVARKSATVRPINSKVMLESGKIFLSILLNQQEINQNMKDRVSGLIREFFEEATNRRPNDAMHVAYQAFASSAVGDQELASQWAAKALDLNERNPHSDKKLGNIPFRLPDYESDLDIEQELLKIRN